MKSYFFNVMGIFALMIGFCTFESNAQTPVSGNNGSSTSFGISAEMGIPKFASNTMSIDILPGIDIPINFVDFSEASDVGFGVSGNIQHTFANNRAAVLAKVGIMNFKVADQGILRANVKAVPVSIGGRVYIFDGLYAGADVGATMVTSKLKATILLDIGESRQETVFTFAPNLGYQLNVGNTQVDIGAKYALVGGKYNYFGVSAGINLPVGKR